MAGRSKKASSYEPAQAAAPKSDQMRADTERDEARELEELAAAHDDSPVRVSQAVANWLDPAVSNVSLQKLFSDLTHSARLMGQRRAKFATSYYYDVQRKRIRNGNQIKAAAKDGEPTELLEWCYDEERARERILKGALRKFANEYAVGQWLMCAPPGSLVLATGGEQVPIETLQDGDQVVAYDRHHSTLTGYRHRYGHAVQVASRNYVGELVRVSCGTRETSTTLSHKWPVVWLPDQDKYVVYLMQKGPWFRVGWCRLFNRHGTKNGRLNLAIRAQHEKADAAWVLKVCDNRRDASLYESYVAANYGLPLLMFSPYSPVQPGSVLYYDAAFLEEFFGMLNVVEMAERAARCLQDHQRHPGLPLYFRGSQAAPNRTHCSTVYAANLLPGMMAIPVPVGRKPARFAPLEQVQRTPYAGPVYSLDVEKHHTYVQDGLCTCNSLTGIGPVIAAGFMSMLDIEPPRTYGKWIRFCGLDPSCKWEAGKPRPWSRLLKTLCWHARESFVKHSGRPSDMYGKFYLERKPVEWHRNLSGAYLAQIQEVLASKRYKTDTLAYKFYSGQFSRSVIKGYVESGETIPMDLKPTHVGDEMPLMPPHHIHLRATRPMAAIFINHVHHVCWVEYFGTQPPVPYEFSEHSSGKHREYVPPFNFPYDFGGRERRDLLRPRAEVREEDRQLAEAKQAAKGKRAKKGKAVE